MSDRYRTFATSAAGRVIVSRLGLPDPARIRPHQQGEPLVPTPVLVSDAGTGGRMHGLILDALGLAGVVTADSGSGLAALVCDATGLSEPSALGDLFDVVQRRRGMLAPSGRVIIFGTPAGACRTPGQAATQQALAGFVRSIGAEFGRDLTAQLVAVSPGAEDLTESTLRFLLSARSSFAPGQVVQIGQGRAPGVVEWARPLAGQVALVLGASTAVGSAVATVLARDGAQVVCAGAPDARVALDALAAEIGATVLAADPADAGAPAAIADELATAHHGVDLVVHIVRTGHHYAGALTIPAWVDAIDAGLSVPDRITAVLVREKVLRTGGRIVAVSPTNDRAAGHARLDRATAQAGLLGYVEAQARALTKHSMTVNAVLPEFVETPISAAMPSLRRGLARRLNTVAQGGLAQGGWAQGGLPMDVAETVSWLGSPASGGVTGNIVRVRGQFMLGL